MISSLTVGLKRACSGFPNFRRPSVIWLEERPIMFTLRSYSVSPFGEGQAVPVNSR